MQTPRRRRPPGRLSPAEVASLVAMRERGSTWMAIGRVFGRQDGACKAIYDRAIQSSVVGDRTGTVDRPPQS